ncbi:helix-turn-helix domain-containing protein [Enterococcus sp. DIV0187]|uniref:helix-turn-helix domain-containing protein n=1 Tax=Enterococcus sp. DIV0187 TaxID=2774644 RepID=UPI003F20D18E
MIPIKNVQYLDRSKKPVHLSETNNAALLIHQVKREDQTEPSISFSLACDPKQKLENNEDSKDELLRILLDIQCGSLPFDFTNLPLKSTEEINQLCYLLFSYYETENLTYPVDVVLESLVNKLWVLNSQLLRGEHSFLSLLVFMYEHRYEHLTMDDFCSGIHVSESTLTRQCRKYGKDTPSNLFRRVKCAEAKRLLNETTLSLEEISERLNFKSPQHFSTVFKKVEGISPLKFRKKNLKRHQITMKECFG